jgi:hypothetical protein
VEELGQDTVDQALSCVAGGVDLDRRGRTGRRRYRGGGTDEAACTESDRESRGEE